jgi:hypothetical protein
VVSTDGYYGLRFPTCSLSTKKAIKYFPWDGFLVEPAKQQTDDGSLSLSLAKRPLLFLFTVASTRQPSAVVLTSISLLSLSVEPNLRYLIGGCSWRIKSTTMEQAPVQIGQFILGKNLGIGAFGKVRIIPIHQSSRFCLDTGLKRGICNFV